MTKEKATKEKHAVTLADPAIMEGAVQFKYEYISESEIPERMYMKGRFYDLKIDIKKRIEKLDDKRPALRFATNIPGNEQQRQREINGILSAIKNMIAKEKLQFTVFYSREHDAFYIKRREPKNNDKT